MAKQGINTGTAPNDGLGDSLLAGAIKINSNFSEIYNTFGNGNTLNPIIGYANTAGIATVAQGLIGTPSIDVYRVGITSSINVGAASTFQKSVHFESTLLIGDVDELQIFHDGTNSYIDNASPGNLILRDSGLGIQLKKSTGALMGVFNIDGGVELYYNSVLKFQTFQNGVAINDSVGIGSTAGNPPYRLTVSGVGATITQGLANAIADFTSSVNGYGQLNVRNSLSGTNASGDVVITANTGNDVSNFIDLGINNTGFTTSSWTINGALDGYLYTSDGNLSIGAASSTKYLSLFAGGTLAANEQVRVTTTGVGIGTTNATSKLTVGGDALITGITTHRDSISIRPSVGGNEYVSISPFGRMVLGSSVGTAAGIDIINNTTSASAEIFTISTPNVNLYDKKIIVDYGGRLLLGGNLDSSLNNAFTVLDNSGNISLTGYVSAGGTIGASGLYAGFSNVSGLTTTINLYVSGVSTFLNGPILIGSATSTGTASQALQVNSGAYISGSVGIGTTNPGSGIKLDVLGGEIKAGRVDSNFEGGQVSFGRATDNATAWYIDVYGSTSTPSLRVVDVSTASVRTQIDSSGNIIVSGIATVGLGSTSTPPNNSQMSFELTSNTNLRIKVRGTDGVLRSANITLA